MFRFLLVVLTICGAGATSVHAAQYGDLEVSVLPQPAAEGGSQTTQLRGYVEIRVWIRNRSAKEDYQVRLLYPPRSSGNAGSELRRASRSVQAVHQTSMVVSLFLPPLESYPREIGVEIDGNLQQETLNAPNRDRGYTSGSKPTLNVLVSRGVPQDWKDDIRTANSGEVLFQRSELPLSEWSPNWLGYTSYDIVLLTRQESESIPAEIRSGLLRYVEAGGLLMIHHPNSVSATQSAIPQSLINSAGPPSAEGAYRVGFGQILNIPQGSVWPISLWADRMKSPSAPSDPTIRIAQESQVPVRGILTLVILFAIVIGPINIWYLSRRKKKMWLWWNVPAVSLATCLVIFVYSLLAEGVRGHARNVAFTLLDERSHVASTLGYASYYCPLTPSGGLHFSSETEVIPLDHENLQPWRRSESGASKTIDWTKDQHLESGWIASRVPVCFGVRKSEIRRERLAFHQEKPGELSVVNGLGAEVESLHYLDASGVFYRAGEIQMGQQVTLEKVAQAPPSVSQSGLREGYLRSWDQLLLQVKQSPETYLRKGTYVAVLRKSPFLEDSLAGVATTGDFGIVFGIAAEDPDGR